MKAYFLIAHLLVAAVQVDLGEGTPVCAFVEGGQLRPCNPPNPAELLHCLNPECCYANGQCWEIINSIAVSS